MQTNTFTAKNNTTLHHIKLNKAVHAQQPFDSALPGTSLVSRHENSQKH